MAWAPLAVAAVRGLQLAASLSVFGMTISWLMVVRAVLAQAKGEQWQRAERHLVLFLRASFAAALGLAVIWLVLQAADFADTASPVEALRAVPLVVLDTRFGYALIVRVLLLCAAAAVFGSGRWIAGAVAAAIFSGAACATQAWMGHAAAVQEGALPASVVVHVLAAGAWLGGLLPLWILLGDLPPSRGAWQAARRFSPLGVASVLTLAGTAFVQGRELIGSIPGLFGTAYGLVALVKLSLFLLLIVLAALNRFRFTPRIMAGEVKATRHLRRMIVLETAVGLTVVLAASRLAELFPGAHEQPVWPFGWRLSPSAFSPDLRGEVIPALLGLGAAIIVAGVSAFWRRIRWPGLATAIAAAVIAVRHLDLLFVPAYPTTFYESLTDFSVGSIARGAKLFAANCVVCHGVDARGNGPVAKDLPIPSLDLTAPHIWAHLDGELFWWLTHGYDNPTGKGLTMPGFAASLSDDDRWDVIDYIHARAAGAEVAAQGFWLAPIQAPEMDLACRNGGASLGDFRGRSVRIVATDETPVRELPENVPSLTTVLLVRDSAIPPSSICVSGERDAWRVYAIVAGVAPDALAGTEFLVDTAGWLRTLWRPGEATPAAVAAATQANAAHPVTRAAVGSHRHR
jgi:putative copper export protein/mono/diheme cytochrome c family protein